VNPRLSSCACSLVVLSILACGVAQGWAQPVFGGISSASSFIYDFSILIQNVGSAKVTVINALRVDGVDIKSSRSTTITLGDPDNTIKYTPSTAFASGSSHTVSVTYTDTTGTTSTTNVGFTTLLWFVLPASASVPASSIDTNQPGFRWWSYQVPSGEPNQMYWAEEELLGLHGTNLITCAIEPWDCRVEGTWNDLIDFGNSTGTSGQFPYDRGWGGLGIPSLQLPNDDNSAAWFAAYLYFPTPGLYVMGLNSDDYSRVTYAQNSHDLLGTEVPGLNSDSHGEGRSISADQNVGAIVVTNAGYYGFRMLYENGTGGSAVEWYFKATPAGTTNVLINDTMNNSNTTVKAYQVSSAAPPYVSYAEPPLDDDQVGPEDDLKCQLTYGATTVNSSSVVLKLNGAAQAPAITNSNGVTTILLPHTPGQPRVPGTNVVDLIFQDSAGTNYAYNYSFVVAPPPTISIARQGSSWVITYVGTLYSSSTIDGAYAAVTGASSPYTVPTASRPGQYYRAHR